MNSVVVHYQEIALKGRNRPWFIGRLVRNIRTATSDLDVTRVVQKMGRIEVMLGSADAWDPVAARLRQVFGIANFSRAALVPLDIDGIAQAVLSDLGAADVSTFRSPLAAPTTFSSHVSADRARNRRTHQTGQGWRVDLEDPELTIHVEALTGDAFYYFGKEAGPADPTGVSGRSLRCSRAASIRRCRVSVDEGLPCRPGALSQLSESLSRASQEKVAGVAALLTRYQQYTRLYWWHSATSSSRSCGRSAASAGRDLPPPDAAHRRSDRHTAHAKAMVTGGCIGQVASQTLENMRRLRRWQRCVFRPLIGMDKDEIIAEAQRLAPFHLDHRRSGLLSLFTPKHPATKARREDIDAAERLLPIDDFVRRRSSRGRGGLNYPVIKYPSSNARNNGSSNHRIEDRGNSRR